MNDTEFNLLHEPWILAMKDDGAVEELSIISVLEQAHEIRTLSGELPTQDMAISRLLLAILYASDMHSECNVDFSDPDQAVDAWFSSWNKQQFDMDKICKYLDTYEDRFYLFHPQRPFYQACIAKGTEYDASKLIGDLSESSNKPRLFSSRGEKTKKQLEYAEAARWLLHINSFDDSSNKPTRGANLPPVGVGWLGKLGLISIQGGNLFETLMLNYVLLDRNEDTFPDGEAIWERNEVCLTERRIIATPTSPLDLLTLQSRRILLKRDGSVVTGFKSIGGDVFPPENALIEQMTVWETDDDNGWKPKRHNISRAMWRDYSAIISSGANAMDPGVVRWVAYLKNNGLDYKTLRLNVVGIAYGDKNSSVDDVFEDSISINAGLLASIGKIWNVRIEANLELTDKCVKEFGSLVSDISSFSGNSDDGCSQVSKYAKQSAYYSLDQPFRRWLQSIDPEDVDSLNDKMNEWLNTTKTVIIQMGKRILDESSETAIVGKDMESNAMNRFRKFSNKIYKIIGGDVDK